MYAVVATASFTDNEGWSGTWATPTFYLNPDVQGILSEEHAAIVGTEVIDPTGTLRKQGATITVTAVKV